MNLNPLGITGPNHPGNVQQPNVSNPQVHPSVGNSFPVRNQMGLSWPIPVHVETDVRTNPHPPFPLS